MKLTSWTYEGPSHIGAMHIATAMADLHYVLHAPQSESCTDHLFALTERHHQPPPITHTAFGASNVDTRAAELFKTSVHEAYECFTPSAMIVSISSTAKPIQDDAEGLAKALDLPIPIIPLRLSSYQNKENWGASETFHQIVRHLTNTPENLRTTLRRKMDRKAGGKTPTCNILGPTTRGFRHRDDVKEITNLLTELGVIVKIIAPLNAKPADIARIPQAEFNVILYPEIAEKTARWLERTFGQPYTKTIPIGIGATEEFIKEIKALAGLDDAVTPASSSTTPLWSTSIASNYLACKRVFIFGDATHAIATARVASEEFGLEVVGLGCYNEEYTKNVHKAAKRYGIDALITDDYLDVENHIVSTQPDLVLGTQMERHLAKRLGLPCAVISAPIHAQDFSARYAPQMGYEGTNVLFDTWAHPFLMELEEPLLGGLRENSKVTDTISTSHLSKPDKPLSHRDLIATNENMTTYRKRSLSL